MKEITLRVPEKKVNIVMELVEELGLEIAHDNFSIPDQHKSIVNSRVKESEKNPARLKDWEEIKDSFKLD